MQSPTIILPSLVVVYKMLTLVVMTDHSNFDPDEVAINNNNNKINVNTCIFLFTINYVSYINF